MCAKRQEGLEIWRRQGAMGVCISACRRQRVCIREPTRAPSFPTRARASSARRSLDMRGIAAGRGRGGTLLVSALGRRTLVRRPIR